MAQSREGWEVQRITNFGGGLNLITDPRRLQPNSPKEQVAELQEALNVEIDKRGAIVTASGYELVSSIESTGGVDLLINYEKDLTTSYLGIVHAHKLYTITNSVTAWNDRGSLGTSTATKWGGAVFKGTSATRRLILGSDETGVQAKKWDGTTLSNIGTTDFNGCYIWETFKGRLYGGVNANMFYSEVEDETDTSTDGGVLGFNDYVIGLRAEADRIQVFTRQFHQSVTFNFDDQNNIAIPIPNPAQREFGALAYGAITTRGNNVRYWGDDNRIYNLGAEINVDESGLPRSVPISEKIATGLNINSLSAREKARAIAIRPKDQWWIAVPFNDSTVNNIIWVYNERWGAWTTRSGFTPSALENFRDENFVEETYFGDALSPAIYKFNDGYSYAGSGYLRRIKLKKFTFGDASVYKEIRKVMIAGSMYVGTTFYVEIRVDNVKRTFSIDNSTLEGQTFSDGYYGDSDLGDLLLGGEPDDNEADTFGFKRYRAFIHIPSPIREGVEMEITIYNSAAGQPWKIDEILIEYQYKSPKKIAPANILEASSIVAT